MEGYVEVDLDELQLKTKLKGYYKNDWDVLLDALIKNRNDIEKDMTGRTHQEKIKGEFESSVGKLAPLMDIIQKTDGLIDQIVYKLYGLSEEEIKIVEQTA